MRRPFSPLPELEASQQAGFRGYMTAKAKMLRKLGVERYRQEDYFDQPAEDLDPDDLSELLRACQQIENGKGFSAENPLDSIDVGGCYALIAAFHFQVTDRRSSMGVGSITDELRCRHRVTPETHGALFNRVT